MTLFPKDGRHTQIIIVTKDEDETQWEMAPAYDLAGRYKESIEYGEFEVIGAYELELSNTGGTVQPISHYLETPAGEPSKRILRIFPDQQDEVEITFEIEEV